MNAINCITEIRFLIKFILVCFSLFLFFIFNFIY